MSAVGAEARKLAAVVPDPSPAEGPTNVIEAIARIMVDLPAIGRGSQASAQQGGYAYRGIEAITSEAQGLCGKYCVVFVPKVVDSDVREITVNGKPWTDTTLKVEYTVYGPGGAEDLITVGPLMAIGRDNSDKGANKAMTQAYKYALVQTFCIGDKKDDADNAAHEADARPEPVQPPPVDPETDALMHELAELVKTMEPPGERDKLASHLRGRFGPSKDMTPEQINEALIVAAGWPHTSPTPPAAEPVEPAEQETLV